MQEGTKGWLLSVTWEPILIITVVDGERNENGGNTKLLFYFPFCRINALTMDLSHKDTIIQVLRRQILDQDPTISMERLTRPHSSSSPLNSSHSIQRGSAESLHNLPRSPGSSGSLHNISLSSSSNLGNKSPLSSLQNLMRSPAGSFQSLVPLATPLSRGHGSQERLLGLTDSVTSLSTSGLSIAGTDGSESDLATLAKERTVLDEKLKQLDQEIAEQDHILESLWKG